MRACCLLARSVRASRDATSVASTKPTRGLCEAQSLPAGFAIAFAQGMGDQWETTRPGFHCRCALDTTVEGLDVKSTCSDYFDFRVLSSTTSDSGARIAATSFRRGSTPYQLSRTGFACRVFAITARSRNHLLLFRKKNEVTRIRDHRQLRVGDTFERLEGVF